VDRLHRARADAVAQQLPGVGAGHADVLQAAAGQAGGGEELVLANDLDAEEVDAGALGAGVD